MKVYKIITTKTFEEEFKNIFHYIHFFLKEPITATKIYNKILLAISDLILFPKRNPKFYFNSKNSYKVLRKFLVSNYILIYEINEFSKEIYILHIFQKNEDYINKLK